MANPDGSPAETPPLTKTDLQGSKWRLVLSTATRDTYSSMATALGKGASAANAEGRLAHGAVLRLFARACSMTLKAKTSDRPFHPFIQFGESRSWALSDFSDAHIAFIASIVDLVDHCWLKARLADIVWITKRPRRPDIALVAIDAYRSIPLTELWVRDRWECWRRAISLCHSMKAGAGNRLADIAAQIVAACRSHDTDDGVSALRLSELLMLSDMRGNYHRELGTKLFSMACSFEEDRKYHFAQDHFSASAKWFQKSSDAAMWHRPQTKMAECFALEAEERRSMGSAHNIGAVMLFEKAIQAYRAIPRSGRAAFLVDERIAELRIRLRDAGRESSTSFRTNHVPIVDMDDMTMEALAEIDSASGPLDALTVFVNLWGIGAIQPWKSGSGSPRRPRLHDLFSPVQFGPDGNVIKRQRALGWDPTSSDMETHAHVESVQRHGVMIQIVVLTLIVPALVALTTQYGFRESDLIEFAARSDFVPDGRELSFAKACLSGLQIF